MGFGFYCGNVANMQIDEKVFRMETIYCENDNRVGKTAEMCAFSKKKIALHLGLFGYNSNDFRCVGEENPDVLFYLLLKGRNQKC